MNKGYAKMLANSRWKAKRLDILKRDNFACAHCQATGRLHVHHIKYTGIFPWQAPDKDLITLCSSCHRKVHNIQPTIEIDYAQPQTYGRCFLSSPYALRKAYDEAGEAMLTLGRVMTMVREENRVTFRATDLAREFNSSRGTIVRHLGKCRELGLIEPDPSEAHRKTNIVYWRICPFLVWKGTGESLRNYLARLPSGHPWLTTWMDPEAKIK
jgi:DNA-binding transcriptional ArsR family regulator